MNVRKLWNWRVVLVFALVGPLAGGACFWLLGREIFSSSAWSLLSVAIFGGVSYIAGLVPALATGLLASVLWAYRPLHTTWWARTATGGALGYGVMLLLQYEHLGTSSAFGDPFVIALVGGAGGAVAGLIACPRVAPNNSFNPMPLRGTG